MVFIHYIQFRKKTFMINEFDFKSLGKEYKTAHFPYIVIDNFLDQKKLCKEIEFLFPNHSEKFWLKYNNPVEKTFI